MPRAGLSAAVGPRGARGEAYILHFQNLVNDDWVQVWGVVRGPAWVQVAVTPGPASVSTTLRIMPLAVQVPAGGYSGAAARDLLGSGLQLVDAAVDGTRAQTLPAIRGGSAEMRFWARVLVPWATWGPAFFVDPTALGQVWTAYLSVTWPAEVAAGVVSVAERPITAAELGRPERRQVAAAAAVPAVMVTPALREARIVAAARQAERTIASEAQRLGRALSGSEIEALRRGGFL